MPNRVPNNVGASTECARLCHFLARDSGGVARKQRDLCRRSNSPTRECLLADERVPRDHSKPCLDHALTRIAVIRSDVAASVEVVPGYRKGASVEDAEPQLRVSVRRVVREVGERVRISAILDRVEPRTRSFPFRVLPIRLML